MHDRTYRILIATATGVLVGVVTNRLDAEFAHLAIRPQSVIIDNLIVGFVSGLCAFAFVSLSADRRARQLAAEKVIEEGAARERTRIACDIHDVLAQCFVGIIGNVEAAQEFLGDSPQARTLSERALQVAREGLVEARSLVRGLRPRAGAEKGLCRTLTDLAETLTKGTQLRVNCSVEEGSGPLTPDTEMQIRRIIREALVNVVRHAGASEAWVTVCNQNGQIQLCIEDNGRGFVPGEALNRETFGLASMRERACQLGGLLWIYTQPGHGTQIVAVIPTS